jgi:hypothetical protein
LIITLLGDKSSVCITIVISGVKTKSVKLAWNRGKKLEFWNLVVRYYFVLRMRRKV